MTSTGNEKSKGRVMRALSALLERTQILQGLGLQFSGERDLYQVFGYNKAPTFENYLQRYSRQDVAGRVVDAPAAAVWKKPPQITGPSRFMRQWQELTRALPVWQAIERADKLAGLGRYSLLFLGFDDGAQARMPVRPSAQRKLLYLQPLGESSVRITKYEKNTKSPRFGLPTEYEITLADPADSPEGVTNVVGDKNMNTQKVVIHHSRVIHILENSLEDRIYGIPRMARVYNILDDLMKVCGGSAETYWLTANRGLHADIDTEMELDADDAKQLADMIDEYQHQLRRVIRTRGVKLNSLGSDVPDPTGTFRMLMALLSGATGIPQRILLGSEAGQLASEQDRANWAERVDERRTSFAEPVILRPFIDALMFAGVLPRADYDIEWPEAFIMSPLERAQEMAQKARSISNLSRQSKIPMQITTVEEARNILGLDGDLPTQTQDTQPDTQDPTQSPQS